jgi:hypothetical protein
MAVDTISKLYDDSDGPFKVASEDRTNSIILLASEAKHTEILALMERIDVAENDNSKQNVRFLPAKDIPDSDAQLLMQVANMMEVQFAFESEAGVAVASADDADRLEQFLTLVEQVSLLRKEEQAAQVQLSRQKLVRVVWLASKLNETQTQAPDGSLESVINRLGKMGHKDLVVAGELLARCAIDAYLPEFQAQGATSAGYRFSVIGRVTSRPDNDLARDVNLEILVTSKAKETSRLGVVVEIVDDKSIILGSTPIEGCSSFFVVQFLDDK